MNNIKKLLCAVTLAIGIGAASAQTAPGFDSFGGMRTVCWPAVEATAIFSNAPVDLRLFSGTVNLIIHGATNTNFGTLTGTVETSPDLTNWTGIANVAIATQTAIKYTNSFYAANSMIATNTYLLPGTITTPTASTAGFASSYLLPTPFTNTPGAINLLTNGSYSIGFSVNDQPRYLHVLWNGTATNFTVAGSLTGRQLSATPLINNP